MPKQAPTLQSAMEAIRAERESLKKKQAAPQTIGRPLLTSSAQGQQQPQQHIPPSQPGGRFQPSPAAGHPQTQSQAQTQAPHPPRETAPAPSLPPIHTGQTAPPPPVRQQPQTATAAPYVGSWKDHLPSAPGWKIAFFMMALAGPLTGFGLAQIFSSDPSGAERSLGSSLLSFGTAGAEGLAKTDRGTTQKGSRLSRNAIRTGHRNCTELALNSRTGLTSAGRCNALAGGSKQAATRRKRPTMRALSSSAQVIAPLPLEAPTAQLSSRKKRRKLKSQPLRPKIVPIRVKPVGSQGIIKRQW